MGTWSKATGAMLAAGGLALGAVISVGTGYGTEAATWEYATVPLMIYESTESKPQADRWGLFAVAAAQAELDVALAAQVI